MTAMKKLISSRIIQNVKAGSPSYRRVSLWKPEKLVPSNRRLYSGERVCYIDTLGVAKSLEAEGFCAKQAESIASELAEKFVSKAAAQQSAAVQDAHFSAFKWDMKCLQDNQLLMLEQERLKLKRDLEQKMESLERNLEKKHAELAAYDLQLQK